MSDLTDVGNRLQLPTRFPTIQVQEPLSTRVKQSEREADHWSRISTPPSHLHDVDRDSFTFTCIKAVRRSSVSPSAS